MKALTTVALMVVAIVLLAPEALAGQPPTPTMQYVDIDTVVLIYSKFYYTETIRMDFSAAEIQACKDAAEAAQLLMWRGSHFEANLNILEFVEPDRALYENQVFRHGNGSYMLYHWSLDGEHSVESDLIDAGYADGDITITVSLWAWNTGANGARYAGECYPGTKTNPAYPHLLGDSAHVTIPVTSGQHTQNLWGIIMHETSHAIDSKLKYSGYPDAMISPDRPNQFDRWMDGGTSFLYENLDAVLWSEWSGMYSWLATVQTVDDTDEDGVPDNANVPLNEVSFGSDKR